MERESHRVMKRGVTRRQTPEERELEKKSFELASLQAELAQRELDLATLHAELRAFEERYLQIVGVRYAELDEIEAQIAEAQTRLNPRDNKARGQATQARAKAQESAKATGAVQETEQPAKFKPSENLKKLYREVAKTIHPDLAEGESDRIRREKFMAEANRAYEEGDEARLQAILNEWNSSPESVKGDGPGAELVRVIRKIAQVERRLRAIEIQIAELEKSGLYRLKERVEEAEEQRRDLLAEMAATLDEQISEARKHLDEIKRKRPEA